MSDFGMLGYFDEEGVVGPGQLAYCTYGYKKDEVPQVMFEIDQAERMNRRVSAYWDDHVPSVPDLLQMAEVMTVQGVKSIQMDDVTDACAGPEELNVLFDGLKKLTKETDVAIMVHFHRDSRLLKGGLAPLNMGQSVLGH